MIPTLNPSYVRVGLKSTVTAPTRVSALPSSVVPAMRVIELQAVAASLSTARHPAAARMTTTARTANSVLLFTGRGLPTSTACRYATNRMALFQHHRQISSRFGANPISTPVPEQYPAQRVAYHRCVVRLFDGIQEECMKRHSVPRPVGDVPEDLVVLSELR